MRIVFWGSSDFSLPALETLAQEGWVCGVVTNPDKPYGRGMHELHKTPVKIWAESHHMCCLQPTKLKDEVFLHTLRSLEADLFVVVSYGRILPPEVLIIPPKGSINLHASLLPKYRGASPIQAALLNGDTETGNTIQYLSESLDCGDIILQSHVPIDPHDTYPSLAHTLAIDGAKLLREAILAIQEGKASRIPQDHNHATYAPIITREDGHVDFTTLSAEEIERRYRAYQPWPGIFATYHQGKHPLSVHFTAIEKDSQQGKPGTILQADKHALIVACKQHSLRLLKLKPAGKKEIDHRGFINGYRPCVGKPF
ncbi:MAG: methionyl-tRNA formyltransferase [Brevinematales bacterium]|nr:methionyl-tRNA formyltransferase [Brevinematales bacterium]